MSQELGSLKESFDLDRSTSAKKIRKGEPCCLNTGGQVKTSPEFTDMQCIASRLKTVQWPKVVTTIKMTAVGWNGWSTGKQERWLPCASRLQTDRSSLFSDLLWQKWGYTQGDQLICCPNRGTTESGRGCLPIITSGQQTRAEFTPGNPWVVLLMTCIIVMDWMFVSLSNSYVKSFPLMWWY